MAIEIVDFPINSMVIFHSSVGLLDINYIIQLSAIGCYWYYTIIHYWLLSTNYIYYICYYWY